MNRHERCIAAITGKPVDRAPRYIPGIACSVASAILGRKAYGGTGSLHYAEACALVQGPAAHQEFAEKLYQDLADLYRTLEVDVFRMPWRMRAKPAKQIDDLTFLYGDPAGRHTIFRYCPGTGDFAEVFRSSQGVVNEEDFEREVTFRLQQLHEGALDRVAVPVEHRLLCERFGREFFVVLNGGDISVELSPERLMLLALAPDVMARDLMNQSQACVALAQRLAETSYPRVLMGGGDMAGNDGPLYSPEAFRRASLPAFRFLMERLHPLGVHYVFRSDGNLWPVSDMLFTEAGVDGYGEVDREVGMTVGALRRRFPRLVLWGNFSSSFLVRASADEVRDEARRILDESAGTGYFHGSSNAILQGTPVENVRALFAA